MNQTVIEKILSSHSDRKLSVGDKVSVKVDYCLSHDANSMPIIESLEVDGLVKKVKKYGLFIDHYSPSPDVVPSSIHMRMRSFAKKYGADIFDIGCGVSNQVLIDNGIARKGSLVISTETMVITLGGINAAGITVPKDEFLLAVKTGSCNFTVPKSCKIVLDGQLTKGVTVKDLALYLLNMRDEFSGYSLEFEGKAVKAFSSDQRLTLANMMSQALAYAVFFNDTITDRSYAKNIAVDITKITPMIQLPSEQNEIVSIKKAPAIKIDQLFLGSCANGRIDDLVIAAKIIKGKKVKTGVKFYIAPISREIYAQALKKGLIKIFIDAGAMVLSCGCGPCVGTHQGVLADGQNAVTTSNRNFQGVMGNKSAFVYLASPATIAASALTGKITDPRNYL